MAGLLTRNRERRSARQADPRPVWAACSALLEYPTEELLASLDDIAALGDPHLDTVVAHLRSRPLTELQQEYVQTFDHTRKCALYLTYYAYGDTRRRGLALVGFKETYRAAGVELGGEPGTEEELPDHLCVVLQFGALVDRDGAWRLLNEHRAGVEMLRLALAGWDDGAGSPWLGALRALCETLPTLQGDEAEAVRRLIEQGPPAEEVGLQPYGADPMSARDASPPVIAPARIPVGAPR